MTIDPWTLYWITRLDYVPHFLTFIIIMFVVLMFGSILYGCYQCENGQKWPRRSTFGMFSSIVGASLMMIVMCLTPTTKEMGAILIVPTVVNNENVQEEVGELYKLAKDWLENQIGDEDNNEREERKEGEE